MNTAALHKQFNETYDALSDAIFRFCLLKVSDREQALDITQEVFTRLWKELHEKKTVANTRAFLFIVARHLIIDWYRKKKSVSLEGMANEETGEAYEPIDELIHEHIGLAAEGRFVIDSINKLSITHRQVIYLRFVEGLSPPDIGEIMGLTANAVSVRINRGLQELRAITGYDIELT